MSELEILNVYEKSNDKVNDNFIDNIDSKVHIITNHTDEDSYEWIDIIEETIPYLDNILRAPNRFIVNEEEIVKIELARRVTVESIKHLSKNTNLIQDYNKKTGDVKPSKILNINKEESVDTYENRFIYSLIKNIQFYIDRKKKNMKPSGGNKDSKKLEYNGCSKLGKEKIDVSMTLNSNLENKVSEKASPSKRIEEIELKISDLTSSSVFKAIDKLHISLVTSPIKKTNVILKNTNFQYALTLWNYLQTHVDSNDSKTRKQNSDFYAEGNIKKCINESFLLNYLVLDSVCNKESKQDKKELSEKLVDNMIEKVISIDPNIAETQLKNMIDKKYSVIKYKTVVNERQIEKKFKKSMDKYLDDIKLLKL